jgi:hypothetical protein
MRIKTKQRQAQLHPANELGRRIQAALISYQLGRSGVDSTLKTMPEVATQGWPEIGERLLRVMTDTAFPVIPEPPVSKKIH